MSGPGIQAFSRLLLDDTTINQQVQSRVYPVKRPQGSGLPALTYFDVLTIPIANHISGSGNLMQSRIQVDAWGATYSDVTTLGETVRRQIDQFSGTKDGIVIQLIMWESKLDDYDELAKTHRVIQDFYMFYESDAPVN